MPRVGNLTAATYATVRKVASSETANFLNAEVKYELCARMGNSIRRILLFLFQHGLLAVPRRDMNFESAPLFFCRRCFSHNNVVAKERIWRK